MKECFEFVLGSVNCAGESSSIIFSLQNRHDFCVFKGTGAKARRAQSASCVRGEVR